MNQVTQHTDTNDYSTFLKQVGWDDATLTPMGADMGKRRYFKLSRGAHDKALLMDMSRSDYESGLEAYLNVAQYLNILGVNVPEIYSHDLKSGYTVIEDLGDVSFGDALRAGQDKREIYHKAANVLMQINAQKQENALKLHGYKDTLIYQRLVQFVDYYMPVACAGGFSPDAQSRADFYALWDEIGASLSPCPMGFCHADYHLENLMWCPEKAGGYGLIDFQDAFWGFKGYDLLNLLEDARVSVPTDIKTDALARYCAGMNVQERKNFEDWYTVLSAHFHCRVIGLFIKFSKDNNSTDFLAHIPRLQGYILNHLKNPVLAPLKEWVARHNISFDVTPSV